MRRHRAPRHDQRERYAKGDDGHSGPGPIPKAGGTRTGGAYQHGSKEPSFLERHGLPKVSRKRVTMPSVKLPPAHDEED